MVDCKDTDCSYLTSLGGVVSSCCNVIRDHVMFEVMNNIIQRSCLHHSPVLYCCLHILSPLLFLDSQGVVRFIIGGSGCN